MESELVIERVRRVDAVRGDAGADSASIEEGLRASAELRAWLAAADAEMTERLSPLVTFPERTIADCTRTSLGEALKTTERAATLAALPEFAAALSAATITAAHVDAITNTAKADAITNTAKAMEGPVRSEFIERVRSLVAVAAAATVRQFRARLDRDRRAVERDDGTGRFERQQRAVSHHSWTDAEGMYCYAARLDPLTGVAFDARVQAQIEALFARQTPAACPTDPVLKQRHLAALAVAALVTGQGAAARSGRPDHVVVVDASQSDGAGGPAVDWGIPVEVPFRVLADLMGSDQVDVNTVVVRNGVVLHAPGALDLGRTSRLANRAQRRALNAVYAACAIPGCDVHYRFTKLHHVHEWEHGGRTDLANLLPVGLPAPSHHAPPRAMAVGARPQPRAHHHDARRHRPHHRPSESSGGSVMPPPQSPLPMGRSAIHGFAEIASCAEHCCVPRRRALPHEATSVSVVSSGVVSSGVVSSGVVSSGVVSSGVVSSGVGLVARVVVWCVRGIRPASTGRPGWVQPAAPVGSGEGAPARSLCAAHGTGLPCRARGSVPVRSRRA
jgi:hypothetical protein